MKNLLIENEFNRLRERAWEEGSKIGLCGLPHEDAVKALIAELIRIAERRYGNPDVNPEWLVTLDRKRQEIQNQLIACQEQNRPLPEPKPPTSALIPDKWRIATALAISATVGLALWAYAIKLNWQADIAIALGATVLAVHYNRVQAFLNRLADYGGYTFFQVRRGLVLGWLMGKRALLDRRISKAQTHHNAEMIRRRFINVWVAQSRELLLSELFYAKAQGEKADQILQGSDIAHVNTARSHYAHYN